MEEQQPLKAILCVTVNSMATLIFSLFGRCNVADFTANANQLFAPTRGGGLVKRAISEFRNPWELKELLDKIKQLLG